ncbi:MAG: nucleotidyltransferase family protein [Clostridia bacterium]|nr:nucleotidyltransferase family protein [Clostridia bacterium]
MKTLSKESSFVIECIGSSLKNVPLDSGLFDGVDLEKVYRIALSHRVIGLVFGALKPHRDKIPSELFEKMSSHNKMMIMSSVARNNSMAEVSEALSKNGIRFLFLKGAVIQNLYPEKYMRYSTDTDVLVEEKDYEKTYPLLKELSYKFDSQNDKHYVFWKKPYVCVEIHKKLVSDNGFFDRVWDNVNEETGVLVMAKEFELTYLLYHMAQNLVKTGGVGIHSVTDVYLYLKTHERSLDKGLFEEYLRETGLTGFFESIKTLGEMWFDGKDCEEFYSTLTDYIISAGRSGDPSKVASGKIDSASPLIVGKTKFLLSKLFLPYNDLKKIYPALGKAPFMLPFFWGMRICGIVFRPEHHGFERAKLIMKKTDRKSVELSQEILQRLELK